MRGRPWPPPLMRSDTLLFLAQVPPGLSCGWGEEGTLTSRRGRWNPGGQAPYLLKVPTVASRRREWGGEPVSAWKPPGLAETAPHGRTHSLALLPWCLAHSPTLPNPGWPSPPLCQGPCPVSLPPAPTQTDSGPSQKSRRDRAREKTLLSSSVGQWPGSEVGTGRGEDGPLVSLRTVGGGASRCLLFPEGRDRIWPGVLLAWLGPRGFRLPAGEPAQPSVPVPFPAGPLPGQDSSL